MIVLRLAWRRVRGRNADLFFPDQNRVYKLFRRGKDPQTTEVSRSAFKAETQAFHIAAKTPSLAEHIPRYFGIQPIDQVLDALGRNCGYRYLLGCCYATQQLAGKERPAFGVPEARLPELESLLEEFERRGIRYASDSSVFGWENGKTLRFIDIATYDANVRALLKKRRLTSA
jgi:hypothetical protein